MCRLNLNTDTGHWRSPVSCVAFRRGLLSIQLRPLWNVLRCESSESRLLGYHPARLVLRYRVQFRVNCFFGNALLKLFWGSSSTFAPVTTLQHDSPSCTS